MKSSNPANTTALPEIASVLNQIEDVKRLLEEVDILERLVKKCPKKNKNRK